MNTLFKKNFWIIKLAGLALLALVLAAGINDVVAGKLFMIPTPRLSEAHAAEPAVMLDNSYGRIPSHIRASDDLSRRRPFNLDEPQKDAVEPLPQPEVSAKPQEMSNTLEESTLPIRLLGTFVASPAEYSYANITVESAHNIASVGSEYLSGRARVVRISPGHIILKEDNRYTFVRLWNPSANVASLPKVAPNAPGTNVMNPPGAPPPITAPQAEAGTNDIAQGVTKTGAYDYTLDRTMIDNQLKDMGKLQSDGRAVPHYKDNQYQGFKLVGVRPGSLYRAIGIRSGDVISSVNGVKIDSPNKALELFEQFKTSSNISVEIERRGQSKTLSYTVK